MRRHILEQAKAVRDFCVGRIERGMLSRTRRVYMDEKLEHICSRAVWCRVCFQQGLVKPALIELAQPRWVGPRYVESRPRIVAILLNPGAGKGKGELGNDGLAKLLPRYRDGEIGLGQVFEFQRNHLRTWGRPAGRFLNYFVVGLGLDLESLAFANLAWCATQKDQYPDRMLKQCFGRHTGPLLEWLNPDVVLLSGAKVQAFRGMIAAECPMARMIGIPHFAHREGKASEEEALASARSEINEIKAGLLAKSVF